MGNLYDFTKRNSKIVLTLFAFVPFFSLSYSENCSRESFKKNYQEYQNCLMENDSFLKPTLDTYFYWKECPAVKRLIEQGCCIVFFLLEKLKNGDLLMSFVLAEIFDIKLLEMHGQTLNVYDLEWVMTFWEKEIKEHVNDCELEHSLK